MDGLTLSATTSSGTIHWFDAEEGGNFIIAGSALVTPIISNSTTYYAEAVNGSCTSAARTSVLATVNEIPSVSAITGASGIVVPQTTQLSCSTLGGIWSSSNNTVASVSQTGLVTAVSAGPVTITYSVTIGDCTGSSQHFMTISPQDPCDALGGMMFGGNCWLPTGVRATDPQVNCTNYCISIGKSCNASVMQAISQSEATQIVHLFHPGVTMTSSGDAPAYQWTTNTGNYFVESNTCTHNDNVMGRERYCVCTPWP